MSYYLLELYIPKPTWLVLADDGRRSYFDAVRVGMASLTNQGVEAIIFGEVDGALSSTGVQQFFAVWKLKDKGALEALIGGIEASGWQGYFDTVNIGGAGVTMEDHLAQLTAL